MARPLLEARPTSAPEPLEQRSRRISQLTASALAAAFSALIIATLVVNRSTNLDPAGTLASGDLEAGTISLVDDDQGRLLFDLADLGPSRPVAHCIEVTYDGTVVPVDLAMRAEANGTLTRYLDVTVEHGTGGGFRNCDGFTADGEVFIGTLAQLAASGWLPQDRILNSGDSRSYRVTFVLQPRQEALGQSASTSFVWEVTPS
ncbi:MAG: hypothetical protein AAF962_18830 [Actinomycetota bacterium]